MTPLLPATRTIRAPRTGMTEPNAYSADGLVDLIEQDAAAIEGLRQLILDGLESGEEGEADQVWLDSLKEGVRQRAAGRR